MGFDKMLANLHGRPVIAHSIAAFESTACVERIVLIVAPGREREFELICQNELFNKVDRIIAGGNMRHLSVWNGLNAIDPNSTFVAVHDGARPLVTPELIEKCFVKAQETEASALGFPIPDTLKRANSEGIVVESIDRENVWAMQTPQVFSTELLKSAYEKVMQGSAIVTDEVSAVQDLGKPVSLVASDALNFKITYPKDLIFARWLLKMRNTINASQNG